MPEHSEDGFVAEIMALGHSQPPLLADDFLTDLIHRLRSKMSGWH